MNAADLIIITFLVASLPGLLMSLATLRTALDDYRALTPEDGAATAIAGWGLVQMELVLLFIQAMFLIITVAAWIDPGASPARTLVLILALLTVGLSAYCRWFVRRRFDRARRGRRDPAL